MRSSRRRVRSTPCVLLSTAIGIGFDFADINPVRALYWSAVLNGLIAPFLLVGILVVARDPYIMYNQCSSRTSQIIVGITTVAMFAGRRGDVRRLSCPPHGGE